LPNRRLIQEHVELLLESSQTPWRFALAFLDIDNFKHINDYYTHAIGDALLVKVAERISSHIRPSDILARISGDEFLLVLSPAENDQDLAGLISNLLQQLKEPFLIEGFEILTSASIGLSAVSRPAQHLVAQPVIRIDGIASRRAPRAARRCSTPTWAAP
jgi:c-di-GMP phosphodiesterase Gmr